MLVNQMNSYVIDENVILNAVHGEKAKTRKPALAEKIFLYRIFRGQDRIFVSVPIRQKFFKLPQKITQNYKNQNLDNHIIPLFLKLIKNQERTTILKGIKTKFKGVKKCDTEFVGVTLQSNATLVTADEDLKNAISKDSKVSNCKCVTVEDIIAD